MSVEGSAECVEVEAPSRLHLGLVNTSPIGARIDGGAGVMLSHPVLRLRLARSDRQRLDARVDPADFRAACRLLGLPENSTVSVEVQELFPAHQGLGSRTQRRLSLAVGLACLHGKSVNPRFAAPGLGRGGTSSIGSWGFWYGGFIVDGGHLRRRKSRAVSSAEATNVGIAPLVYSGSFPWHIVIAIRRGLKLTSGALEAQLFERLTPTPADEAAIAYRLTYGELLPAVVEGDFSAFNSCVDALMKIGLKRRELEVHGSSSVAAMDALRLAGLGGVGMSSWGPTFFGFARTSEEAVRSAEALMTNDDFSRVVATVASPRGATVTIDDHSSVGAIEVVRGDVRRRVR